ncbi:MAG: SdiA-regulated domain-containing protein, partial [Nocardiopsaceae bacterium]|nr:SdiA-regulated domain-containing protein [Nocardiopsaceae bacterium]
MKRSVSFVAVSVLAAGLAVAAPAAARADTAITGVDLSQYSLVGRYNLPEPTRTTPPVNSLLAQEASSVTYDWDDDSLYVVGDGGTSVVHVSKTGQLIDSMTLPPGNSPQGTTFFDTEGITYVGNGQFVITEERDRQVDLFTYVAGGTLTRADAQTVKLGTTIGNTGLEGISYDPASTTSSLPGFIVVKEQAPEGIFQTNIDFPNGTASNGSPTADEATNLFDPSLVGTADFSDIYALSNQPSLAGTAAFNNLLIDSQESGKLVEVDRSGNIQSSLDIVDAGAPLSVADETHEGVTMDRDGNIYMVNENGGGDSNHPQLWVYSADASGSAAVPRVAVTEVDSAGSGSSYGADWFELTNTGSTDVDLSGWKMDDSSNAASSAVPMTLAGGAQILPAGKSAVFLEDTDTGAGTTADPTRDPGIDSAFAQNWYNTSTLPDGFLVGHYGGQGVGLFTGGDGVNIFDSSGRHVTGVSFGSPTGAATFDNTARQGAVAAPVMISEASVETVNKAFTAANGEIGSPDGIEPAGSGNSPPSAGTIVVSEVSPWGSGNAPYAADWFELTNTGNSSVSLAGWKMDDNSNSVANAVALTGLDSLPAGKSAIFMEDTGAD